MRRLLTLIMKFLPLKNYIVFESIPTYTDNTKAVFDMLLEQGFNKHYKLFWLTNDDVDENILKLEKNKNVFLLSEQSNKNVFKGVLFRIYSSFVLHFAKLFISCNGFFTKFNPKQHNINLAHGEALKNCRGKYSLPNDVDKVMCLSDYLAEYDAYNFSCSIEKMLPLGYPRNDELFGEKIDLEKIFVNSSFEKSIFWMPTFRQHKNGKVNSSSVSFPIIYTTEIAENLNEFAKQKKVLLIIKPHPAQDISKISEMHLSNLEFINNEFLRKKSISNYELLRSVDAMITDYSSVYYDYMLCDKPIGLCFDDFDEFEKNNGFTVDPNYIFTGGEKIYNANDLMSFINRISESIDVLSVERNELKNVCHNHVDNNSTKRVVNYIFDLLKS